LDQLLAVPGNINEPCIVLSRRRGSISYRGEPGYHQHNGQQKNRYTLKRRSE
jgi:hypothetical protein